MKTLKLFPFRVSFSFPPLSGKKTKTHWNIHHAKWKVDRFKSWVNFPNTHITVFSVSYSDGVCIIQSEREGGDEWRKKRGKCREEKLLHSERNEKDIFKSVSILPERPSNRKSKLSSPIVCFYSLPVCLSDELTIAF